MLRYVVVFTLVAVSIAQDFDYPAPRPAPPRIKAGYSGPTAPKPTPVAIIKQINRHNDDGSYTYGYESGDGSFKIETKLPTGEVKGKYGYVDDTGKVRVIEYGATKHGFAPVGEGITVPPPTLVDETTDREGALLPEYSGAYNSDQQEQAPEAAQNYPRPRPQQASFEFSAPAPRPRPAATSYSPPQTFESAPEDIPLPRPSFSRDTLTTTFDFPSRPAPVAPSRPAFSPAPAPLRPAPAFSNAGPAPLEPDFGSFGSRPSPKITYAQPAPLQRPAPQSFAPIPRPAPVPQYRPAPAPQYRPAPAQLGGKGGGSILDQLSKEYALPQTDSAPLHDISFGYY